MQKIINSLNERRYKINMKKTLIILISIIVIGVAAYTVNSYNSNTLKQTPNKSDTTSTTTSIAKNDTVNNPNKSSDTNNSTVDSNIVVNKTTLKQQATDFKLKDLKGNEVSLSNLKGKNVYLNFWATWCPPCKGEMPDIEKLYEETKDTDLVILAIDIGEDKNNVESFVTQNKYNFTVLLDSKNAVANDYNISAIPSSFFINKEGKLISQKTGAMSLKEMREYVKALNK